MIPYYEYYDRKEERRTIHVGKTRLDCELYEHLTLEGGPGGWYIGRFWLNENIPGQVVQMLYGWVDVDYKD